MLKIEGKTFMNIQEAVQWLLDNNCIPFQCTADYQANTEIGLGTIVNPSPAKVRIGSLIFFADSKVSTVIGITETGFICSDKYNDLVDDIVYVSNVAINASGHLICTLSNGDTIDAGLIKQVSNFSINGSQHLIATYNDGTTTDLGAIFNGNINISGTLNATAITGDSIIETMSDAYYFVKSAEEVNFTVEFLYAGAVKNGNKLTVVLALNLTLLGTAQPYNKFLGQLHCPQAVMDKLIPTSIGGNDYLALTPIKAMQDGATGVECIARYRKDAVNNYILIHGYIDSNFTPNVTRYMRLEQTFLLSNNLIH